MDPIIGFVKRTLAARGYEVRTPRSFPRQARLEQPWVLVSYLGWAFSANDERLAGRGHTNAWASREFARALVDSGYNVLGVDWRDDSFQVDRELAAVIDIGSRIAQLDHVLPGDCKKILYCTTSDPHYQNAAEARRVEALRQRRGVDCITRRQFGDPHGLRQSLELCDAALLDGNEHTLSTYPEGLRAKFRLIGEPGSEIGPNRKRDEDLAPVQREFLWYFGAGAVHKGLDLVLEVFARRPELVLHVVGNAPLQEPDFAKAYSRELTELENIRVYGALEPGSSEFGALLQRSFAFVAPSCSESTSSAVVTCLKAGLYPIISRDCGFALPPGAGKYLETCSLEEIEDAVLAAHALSDEALRDAIRTVRKEAEAGHSRERFAADLRAFLGGVLAKPT